MEAREDIEHILMVSRLPPGAQPIYDTEDLDGGIGYRQRALEVRMLPPHIFEGNRVPIPVIEQLRSDIVRTILSVRARVEERRMGVCLNPFTLVGAHEVMANRDLCLRSFLVSPEFAPLLQNVSNQAWWGRKTQLFVHYEVPFAEVYGFAEPEYVGVVTIRDGIVGSAICNPNGLLWGRFGRRRPGV